MPAGLAAPRSGRACENVNSGDQQPWEMAQVAHLSSRVSPCTGPPCLTVSFMAVGAQSVLKVGKVRKTAEMQGPKGNRAQEEYVELIWEEPLR